MCIIATDILSDLCGLSLGLLVAMLPIGLMLWLFGWWSHRFWIVLTTTVLAGVFGLMEATTWHAQPIVVAVLLAIAAGVLALALIRVITFSAGGLAGVYLAQLILPTLQQHAICFLVSGMVCLLLFRWFFMVLTSFLGAVLAAYATLALMNYCTLLDVVAWCDENSVLLTVICCFATFVGFAIQLYFDRWRVRKRKDDGEDDVFTMFFGKVGFGGKKSKRQAA